MPHGNGEQIFPVFFGVWVVLGVAAAAFFSLSKDASLKRKVWPPLTVGTGVLFLGFVWLMGFPVEVMYIAVPAVALIAFTNLRATRFCDSCGKTLMSQNPFSKPEFCSKCGATLAQ